MTVVSYALGKPRPAVSRGGDCRAFDVDQDRKVIGPHRFVETSHCRIENGMLRVTVGAVGAAPALTVAAVRGRVVVGDLFSDLFSDIFPGSLSEREWIEMGTLTVDSPSVSAVLTGVRLVDVTEERVIIRLIVPLMSDAYVRLERGERQVHIQHGDPRRGLGAMGRRVRWTDSPSPTGTAAVGRVVELAPEHDSFPRYVGAIDPVTVDAGGFSVTAGSAAMARFGAGVGTYAIGDRPEDMHWQLGDASKPIGVMS